MVSIYGLIDPRDNQCRYVGKTNNFKRRGREHVLPANLRAHTHKNKWLKSLIKNDVLPDMFVLEETCESDWEVAEEFWIGYLRMIGSNLTNGSSGGEGGEIGADGRHKQAAALRGRSRQFSEEHRANIAIANRVKARDPSCREKMSVAAKLRCQREPGRMQSIAYLGNKAPRKHAKTVECQWCGEQFTANRSDHKYCTSPCGQAAWKSGLRIEKE